MDIIASTLSWNQDRAPNEPDTESTVPARLLVSLIILGAPQIDPASRGPRQWWIICLFLKNDLDPDLMVRVKRRDMREARGNTREGWGS